MSRRACRLLSPLVAALAFLEPSHACVVHFDFPSIPLPPLPAARPIEDFLPARGAPSPVVLPPQFPFAVCGGAFELQPTSPLGLIDLFGSTAHFATALAARRVDVAELWPRTDLFSPAKERTSARRLAAADALRLRAWLTSDANYLWDEDLEWPLLSRGVRVTFFHAGRIVTIDLHPAEAVAVVGFGESMSLVKLQSVPSDVEAILARALP